MRSHPFLVCLCVAAAALMWFSPRSAAQERDASGPLTLVHCGDLLAVPGEPALRRATVVIDGDRIIEVAPRLLDASRVGAAHGRDVVVIDLTDRFVLPGLIDCHTHVTSELSPDWPLRFVQNSEADVAIESTLFAKRLLDAGFTTIRNVGSWGDTAFALRDAINKGIVPGPRILCAGRSITPTGGHGDVHGYREDLFDLPTEFKGVADGVDRCRKAVRAQVKRGADLIKITATGGVLSRIGAGTEQQFFDDELRAIVETAHLLGKKVAAHAHGTRGINAALRSGVDSIEHGSFLDEESIRLFIERGAYLVPTLLAGETVVQIAENAPDQFDPPVREKALEVGPEMIRNFARAHRGGVKIAFGTDSGVSRHGINAREFELMVEAGMSAEDAIVSATINAADLCGLGDQIGTIEPGKAADLIAVAADPRDEISTLHDVLFVMRAGVVHKHQR